MDSLRRRAEELVKTNEVKPKLLSPEETQRALHELRVHQIEMEMQNEELLSAQDVLAAEREKYFDFYNSAPVGYATLSGEGLILEANLTIATMLGVPRCHLACNIDPLTRFTKG